MTKRTRRLDISKKVKDRVWERDGGACVVCGCMQNVMPNAHYISRAHGGLGIEENVVTLCTDFTKNKCHSKYDNGTKEQRTSCAKKIRQHLQSHYPDWDVAKLLYRKGEL